MSVPKTVRLTKTEEKELNDKCIEINKILITRSMPPVRESELVHKILEIAVKKIRISREGLIYIKKRNSNKTAHHESKVGYQKYPTPSGISERIPSAEYMLDIDRNICS
jgi:hypothetical protein